MSDCVIASSSSATTRRLHSHWCAATCWRRGGCGRSVARRVGPAVCGSRCRGSLFQVADRRRVHDAVAESGQAGADLYRVGGNGAPWVYVRRLRNLVDGGEARPCPWPLPVDVDPRRDARRVSVRGRPVDEFEAMRPLGLGRPIVEVMLAPEDRERRDGSEFETGHCRTGGQPWCVDNGVGSGDGVGRAECKARGRLLGGGRACRGPWVLKSPAS